MAGQLKVMTYFLLCVNIRLAPHKVPAYAGGHMRLPAYTGSVLYQDLCPALPVLPIFNISRQIFIAYTVGKVIIACRGIL